ncbi:MAG: RNA polymerase sigma factor [Cyclonatronaceae bacterium]
MAHLARITPLQATSSLKEKTDEQLMKALQGGNDQAFNLLMKRYRRRLYHYLLGYTRSPEDAEDLVQETFFRVYKSRNAYEEIARFSTWLYTIAINLARTHFKKQRRVQYASIDETYDGKSGGDAAVVYQLPDISPAADETLHSKMMVGRVKRAIYALPEEYGELLHLRENKEMSYEEIASAAGLPMGTVKSRINRGRTRLQQVLAKAL